MKESLFADQYNNLWILLAQTREAIMRALKKELNQYDISPAESGILFIIKVIGDRATPAEISRWVYREPHSIGGLVSRMEKKGLVRRVKDLERRNLVRVALTEKGRQAHEHTLKRESIHKIMSSLSKEECQQLKTVLLKLMDKALEELGIDYRLLDKAIK